MKDNLFNGVKIVFYETYSPSAKKETRNIKLRTKRDSIHFTADVDFIVQFKEPLIHAS